MSYMDILVNITLFVFVVGSFIYFSNEIRRQDREFAEWQKEAEKKA